MAIICDSKKTLGFPLTDLNPGEQWGLGLSMGSELLLKESESLKLFRRVEERQSSTAGGVNMTHSYILMLT